MNPTLRDAINNAINYGVARGWVVQNSTPHQQKEPTIMSNQKPDFSKIDFSKVDFGTLKGDWKVELGTCELIKLSTIIDGRRRTVATIATLDVEPWQVYFDRCVDADTLKETAKAIEVVDAFIASQPVKKLAVKTPVGYQWQLNICSGGYTRCMLVNKSTGKRAKAMEYSVKLAREILEKYGSNIVDLKGNMKLDITMQCEEV